MILRNLDDLERLQADGKISPADADEIRRFADFLGDAGSPRERDRLHVAMHRHYPEDLRRARVAAGLDPDCCADYLDRTQEQESAR